MVCGDANAMDSRANRDVRACNTFEHVRDYRWVSVSGKPDECATTMPSVTRRNVIACRGSANPKCFAKPYGELAKSKELTLLDRKRREKGIKGTENLITTSDAPPFIMAHARGAFVSIPPHDGLVEVMENGAVVDT